MEKVEILEHKRNYDKDSFQRK